MTESHYPETNPESPLPAVTIVSHPAFARHDTGEHPECAARWERAWALLQALAYVDSSVGAPLAIVVPMPIEPEILAWVHPPAHAARIAAFCAAGGGRIDEDTVACPASYDVALLSAGAAIAGVQAVAGMGGRRSVVLCRPPGHHALADRTMGFCFFNNAALAARYAQRKLGLTRIAVIDWDVHHGNGTEAIFYDDPSVLYVSTHQTPNWPGTGECQDIGLGAGAGYTLNVPLPIGTGDDGFRLAFDTVIRPVVKAFEPDLIIVSAGYDAHWCDPLGQMGLTVNGYAALTREVMAWADAWCDGRLVLLMEGGYHLEALAHSLVASVQVLRGGPVSDPLGPSPYAEPRGDLVRAIAASQAALAPYWPALAPIS